MHLAVEYEYCMFIVPRRDEQFAWALPSPDPLQFKSSDGRSVDYQHWHSLIMLSDWLPRNPNTNPSFKPAYLKTFTAPATVLHGNWNFRTRELSFPGTKVVPWNFHSLELSFSTSKLAWNFRFLTLIIRPILHVHIFLRTFLITAML